MFVGMRQLCLLEYELSWVEEWRFQIFVYSSVFPDRYKIEHSSHGHSISGFGVFYNCHQLISASRDI